jgi:hypothetical protein
MEIVRKVLCILLVAILCSCAGHKTERAERIDIYGYFGDYTMFRKGDPNQALYIYRKPEVDFTYYDKALLDPVIVWRERSSRLKEISNNDAQMLASSLHKSLYKKLSEYYQVVTSPEKNAMRLTVALIDIKETNVSFGAMPSALVTKTLSETLMDKPALVGEASVELKVTDAVTGEILAAIVDRRLGSGKIQKAESQWEDVNNIFNYWANMLGYRLCLEFGRKNCVPPPK